MKNYHALLVTGIASPKQMEHDLKPMVKSMQSLSFGDHHRFKNKDITRINEAFEQMPDFHIVKYQTSQYLPFKVMQAN
ncbi:Tetraacyldisaccharide-1-P 4'-kinase [Segatella copri]|nr:Tetraacyldisaccharide-1-P 4'-kinase [Segatella copri]